MPYIAAGEAPAMPSSSKAPLADQSATQSFSALLERANPSTNQSRGSQQNLNQATAPWNYSRVGDTSTREVEAANAKATETKTPSSETSEFKTDDSQGRSNVVNQTLSQSRGPQQSPNQGTVLGNYLRIGNTSAREVTAANAKIADIKTTDTKTSDSKTSDSKASDSQNRGNAASQTSAPSQDGSNQSVPVAVVQPTLSQALPWNAGIENFTLDTLINPKAPTDAVTFVSPSEAEAIPEPSATIALPLRSASSQDFVLAEPQTGIYTQDSGNPVSTSGSDAAAVAGVVTDRSDAVAVDSKTPSVNAPLVLHNPPHGPVEIAESVNKTKAAVEPEPSHAVVAATTVPLALIPPILISPMPVRDPGQMDLGSTKGTRDKPVTEKSRISATPDSGTQGNTIEMTVDTKTQPRKDDSPSFASSPATDSSTDGAPLNTIVLSSTFSLAGTQSSPIAGDGKSASDVVPTRGSDQQPGQPEQKSADLADTQLPGETAAAYPTSLLHSARLVERIGEAELRLGIRAGEFGSVDIRTTMGRNQFSVEISVEGGALGRVMAAELPSLQSRLTEQGVPVASLTVQNHAQNHTGSSSTASDQQRPRDGQQPYAMNSASAREESPMPMLVALDGTAMASRLDIHM